MYFQNALSMIERKINSEVRYALNFKRTVFEQIVAMEHTQLIFHEEVNAIKNFKSGGKHSTNEQHDKIVALLTNNQPLMNHPAESSQHPLEVDAKDALANEHAEYVRVAADIRAKSQNLIRNSHQYLCYLYLLSYN